MKLAEFEAASPETIVPWCHGAMVPWSQGSNVAWYHGSMVTQSHGTMALQCHDTMAPLCHDIFSRMACYHGAMIPWYHVNMARCCHGQAEGVKVVPSASSPCSCHVRPRYVDCVEFRPSAAGSAESRTECVWIQAECVQFRPSASRRITSLSGPVESKAFRLDHLPSNPKVKLSGSGPGEKVVAHLRTWSLSSPKNFYQRKGRTIQLCSQADISRQDFVAQQSSVILDLILLGGIFGDACVSSRNSPARRANGFWKALARASSRNLKFPVLVPCRPRP